MSSWCDPLLGESSSRRVWRCRSAPRLPSGPADVSARADALRLDTFGVTGASGGGPYALAVARTLPERVIAVGLVCSMAPLEAADTTGSRGAQGARLALRHPLVARAALAE